MSVQDDEYSWGGVSYGDLFMEIAAAETEEAAAEEERCARVASLEQLPKALISAVEEVREVGPARVEELEVACWVELGALLDEYAALNGARPASQQLEPPRLRAELLGLLPHEMPSSLGAAARWPDGFSPLRMLELVGGSAARVDPTYPSWRRGARLSFALADVLEQIYSGGGGADGALKEDEGATAILQELLEAMSTTDRLRLVLRRMREARERLS